MSSYSYDLTHTLQFNMAPCHLPTMSSTVSADRLSSKCQFWQTDVDDGRVVHDSSCAERDVEDASCVLQADLFTDISPVASGGGIVGVDSSDQTTCNTKHSGVPDSSAGSKSTV